MVSRKYLILVAMTGMLVSLDQLTKFLVTSRFHLGETKQVIADFFNMTLVYNSGAAFGILSNLPEAYREPFFFVVPGITLVFLLVFFSRVMEERQLTIYALSLIVGGALGNMMDRLRIGKVIDFLDFHWRGTYHFPAFNLADSAITLGVFLLFLSMIYEKEAEAGAS